MLKRGLACPCWLTFFYVRLFSEQYRDRHLHGLLDFGICRESQQVLRVAFDFRCVNVQHDVVLDGRVLAEIGRRAAECGGEALDAEGLAMAVP